MSEADTLPSLASWRATGQYFSHAGRRIFYQRAGSGPVLVLVHGFPTASWDFYKLWPALTRDFDVIAPDLLGFGFSDKPRNNAYLITEQAQLICALLRSLAIKSCHLLCHDYGDTVGQELLALHEEKRGPELLSVCMLNGGLFPETHRPQPIQRLLASPLGPWLARLSNKRSFARGLSRVFGPDTQPSSEELSAFWQLLNEQEGRARLSRLLGYMEQRRKHRERWVGALLRSRVRLRVIDGVLDPVSGEHMVRRLEQLKPGADVLRLQVGHYPQIEAPREVLAGLRDLWSQAPTAPKP